VLTILDSSSGPARGMTAERVAAHRLVDAGYHVTLIGGRNRGHDLVAEKEEESPLLVDAKALTPTKPSVQRKSGCTQMVYCRNHAGWSPTGRTHLGLVTLPGGETLTDYDGVTMTITVPVEGARLYLVPLAAANDWMERRPGWDWLWLPNELLNEYRI
jgi:hypothetical protein